MTLPPIEATRARFPALGRTVGGVPVAYLDGPGGTQAPATVIDAIGGYLARGNSNLGGHFGASDEAMEVTEGARSALADLFGAKPEEVATGQNMTSLTYAVSRALARTWAPGDEIVVTDLDHEANIGTWKAAAADAGVEVRTAEFDAEDGRLPPDAVTRWFGPKTRLLAVTGASNAIGTVTALEELVAAARSAGVTTYVDAVHLAPHRPIDFAALGCDFMVASAYKFFGPHIGALVGRTEILESIAPYKIAPAPDTGPGRWETGTQSFEALAGAAAAVEYISSLGTGRTRRAKVGSAMAAITHYETELTRKFLYRAAETPGLSVYGVAEPEAAAERTPTFAVRVDGRAPGEVAARLGEAGIYVWDGHYYAMAVMRRLGLLDDGGAVRIGFMHYNTAAEVDRVLDLLESLAQ